MAEDIHEGEGGGDAPALIEPLHLFVIDDGGDETWIQGEGGETAYVPWDSSQEDIAQMVTQIPHSGRNVTLLPSCLRDEPHIAIGWVRRCAAAFGAAATTVGVNDDVNFSSLAEASDAIPAEDWLWDHGIEPADAPDGLPILPEIDPTTLHGRPVPARRWHVEDLIPCSTVTALSGDGGTGKSLIAAQLRTADEVRNPAHIFADIADESPAPR